jgi:hypothetical protein
MTVPPALKGISDDPDGFSTIANFASFVAQLLIPISIKLNTIIGNIFRLYILLILIQQTESIATGFPAVVLHRFDFDS